MREKPLPSTPCETQAVRVQHLFCKDKIELLCWSTPKVQSETFSNKYKCDPIKAPKVPVQLSHPPSRVAKKRKEIKPRHIIQEHPDVSLRISIDKTHQNSLNFIESEQTLASSRVAYCTFKEHFLVCKRLKYLSLQQHMGTKKHQIVPIPSTPSQQQQQPWDRGKPQHHFQIDRIIKCLAD